MKELVVKQFSDEEFVLIDDIEYKKGAWMHNEVETMSTEQ